MDLRQVPVVGSRAPWAPGPVTDFGLGRAARARLGQTPEEWMARARQAVSEHDRLVKETATIADVDARGEILKWIGRADLPGSPAERYTAVRQDVVEAEAAGPAEVFGEEIIQRRIGQLEESVSEFGSKVSNALEAYGALPVPDGTGGTTQAAGRMALCVTGGIALLGLVILPLFVVD